MYKQIETSTKSIVYVSMVRKMEILVATPLHVCASFGLLIVRDRHDTTYDRFR